MPYNVLTFSCYKLQHIVRICSTQLLYVDSQMLLGRLAAECFYLVRLVTERYVEFLSQNSKLCYTNRKLPNPPVMATLWDPVKRHGTFMKDAWHRQTYKVRTSYWDKIDMI
jgi:hypothetical protein